MGEKAPQAAHTAATDSGTPYRPRHAWADAIKAGSILLVVLGHAGALLQHVEVDVPEGAESFWFLLTMVLRPIRVPLFFAISGFFAVRVIHGQWAWLLQGRVANSYWVYALWLIILTALFTTVLPPLLGTYSWSSLGTNLIMPANHIWYLWALAAYLILARLMRSFKWIALGAALVLNLLSGIDVQPLPENVVRNFLFFLIGAYLPQIITGVSGRVRPTLLAFCTVLYLAMALGARALELGEIPAVITAMSFVGMFVAVQYVVLLVRIPWVAKASTFLGPRTLPIYVTHVPLLVLTLMALNPVLTTIGGPVASVMSAALPLIATVTATTFAVTAHAILVWLPAGYLWRIPPLLVGKTPRATRDNSRQR